MTRALEAVLFDIDDTLLDTAAAFARALHGSLSELTPLTQEQADAVIVTWRADAGGRYRAFIAGELGFVEQRRMRLDEVTDLLGLPRLDDAGYARWDHAYERAFQAAWTPFEDARAAVLSARAAGLGVAVVTNAPHATQVSKLAAVGLDDRLTDVVALDTVGAGKPDPRIFLAGCEVLGSDPTRTLYVGDELDTDAVAALAAGLQGAWLDRPGRRRGGPHAPTPDSIAAAVEGGVLHVRSLTELAGAWSPA